MRSSNPALISDPFIKYHPISATDGAMTVNGTINKTAVLLLLVMLPATFVWRQFFLLEANLAAVQGWMMGGLFAGFILALATVFKTAWAPFTAPLYAIGEGLFLGGISAIFEQSYPGIVMQAVSLTVATLLAMLAIYQAGWIRVTERFKWGITAATGGIAIVYLGSFLLNYFFHIQASFIYGSSLFSILFSLFVVGIAAFNFILDFDMIEKGAQVKAPKYMEWYGAFALMVTLIWLYVEILRLLSKINDKRS